MPFAPEVGKCYTTRDGRTTGPVRLNPLYPKISAYKFEGNLGTAVMSWDPSGRFDIDVLSSDYDLMGECIDNKTETLVLAEGRWYRDRDGVVRGPLRDLGDDKVYRWAVRIDSGYRTWRNDGRWFQAATDGHDLVAEVPAPATASLQTAAPKASTLAQFQLELGKYYEDGFGLVWGPLKTSPAVASPYIFMHDEGGRSRTWRDDGRYRTSVCRDDLIREVPAPRAIAPLQAASPKASTPTQPKLQLELGKYYEDRNGVVWGPMRANPSNQTYIFTVPGQSGWRADGRWSSSQSATDLIREVPAPNAVPAGRVELEAEPAAPEKPVIPIDQMRPSDYQRGVDAIWDTFRLLP